MKMPSQYLDEEGLDNLGALIPAPAMDAIVRAMIKFAQDYKDNHSEKTEEAIQERLNTTKIEQ